jgi:hypothetical protein
MNYEKNGWKWDYPPAMLSKARAFDVAMKAARNGGRHELTIEIVLLVMGVLLAPLFIICSFVAHRKKEVL